MPDVARRKQWPSDQEILSAITELAGDGYCPAHDLVTESFRDVERRAAPSES